MFRLRRCLLTAAVLALVPTPACRTNPRPIPLPASSAAWPAASRDTPPLDVVLAAADKGDAWWPVVERLQQGNPDVAVLALDPVDPESVLPELGPLGPVYAILVLPPEAIDVNFAWRWLRAASHLDDDPFVDLCYGVVTGATPEDALAFLDRIDGVRRDPSLVTPRLLDCLGPNQLDNDRVIVHPRLFWGDWLRGKVDAQGMNNGLRGYSDGALDKLAGYGIYHFGGHGYPDRIDQGLTAAQLAQATLGTSVVFNGACSTGVTHRAFEMQGGQWAERTYPPAETFCLTMLRQPIVAYLAATHPDHGVPVYQELEHWLTTGSTLGEVMKHTHDQVVVANGGRELDFPVLAGGDPLPQWGPTEIMLYGTASRLLFGDPRLRIAGPVGPPVVSVLGSPPESSSHRDGRGTVRIPLRVDHPEVAFSLMDTFHSDMAAIPNGFNDRVYARVAGLHADTVVQGVQLTATAGGREVQSRLVGHAVEDWRGDRLLHVQADFPSTGYQQGPMRVQGATVDLVLRLDRR